MSKPVKELIRKELIKRLEGVTSMAVVSFIGVDAVTNHKIRGRLREKGISISVVKNSLAKQAFKELGADDAAEMLEGPCAVAYGADSVVTVVRELLDMKKDAPTLTVKAALLDGEVFGSDRVEELSKYPTRDEAIAGVLQCILSPGGKLAACLVGPGSKLAGILKTIEEQSEEPAAAEEAAPEPAAEAPAEEESPAAEAEATPEPVAEAPAEEAPAPEAEAASEGQENKE